MVCAESFERSPLAVKRSEDLHDRSVEPDADECQPSPARHCRAMTDTSSLISDGNSLHDKHIMRLI